MQNTLLEKNHDEMDPYEEYARIVSLMVLETDICVGHERKLFSLIHYLCTYPSM